MPGQPFYVIDLACLLAFCWLFVALADRLIPGSHTRFVAWVVCLLTVPCSPAMTRAFAIPWTTTPTVVLTLASLTLALDFFDAPTWQRRGAAMGAVTTAIGLFRPTETLIVAVPVALLALLTLAFARLRPKQTAQIAAAGIGGALLPLALLGALYAAIYGDGTSAYIAASREIGFEWRLMALRWVTLFVSPHPLFDGSLRVEAMIGVFWWLVPGVVGMVAVVTLVRGRLLVKHLFVMAVIVAHVLLFLAYRDLNPIGLFRFRNYHYFKWLLPIVGMYAAVLLISIRRWHAWGMGVAVAVALFCWRAVWQSAGTDGVHIEPPRTIVVDNGFHSLRDAVKVTATGPFNALYLEPYTLHVGDIEYHANIDIKGFPIANEGLLLTVLREVPPAAAVFTLNPQVTLHEDASAELGRQAIVFGLPSF